MPLLPIARTMQQNSSKSPKSGKRWTRQREQAMKIREFEQHRYEKHLQDFCQEQGPPPHLHDKLKWGYGVDPKKQTVELYEIRPHFMEPSKKIQSPIAKASYVNAQKSWKVYWMRGNGKWTLYEPCPSLRSLEEFLKLVHENAYGCFFG